MLHPTCSTPDHHFQPRRRMLPHNAYASKRSNVWEWAFSGEPLATRSIAGHYRSSERRFPSTPEAPFYCVRLIATVDRLTRPPTGKADIYLMEKHSLRRPEARSSPVRYLSSCAVPRIREAAKIAGFGNGASSASSKYIP